MESGAPERDVADARRGQLVTTATRWISWGLCVVVLAYMWEAPRTRPWPALVILVGYAAVGLFRAFWLRRRAESRRARVLHDVVDAALVGFGAASTGGFDSPMWLLLYPHVVAVAVRGGLAYALAFGVFDALIVAGLALFTPDRPLGVLHSLTILFCAFMGGSTSSHLKSVRRRLREANRTLSETNLRLSAALGAHEEARSAQEDTLTRLTASEERYRLLLERIQDGVVIVRDGRLAYVNAPFAALVGAPVAELVGTELVELVPPEDRLELAECLRDWGELPAPAGGFETRLLTRAGQVLLASVRTGPVEFQGRPSTIATVRDITGERRLAQELKANAARLAAVNEIANAVNLSLTLEDIFVVAADEARRLLPFDRLTAALEGEGGTIELVSVGERAERRRPEFGRDEVEWAFRRPIRWCQGADGEAPSRLPALLGDAGVQAVLTVPLRSKERVTGSLNLGRFRREPFTPADLALLESLARHVAIALDNARLLEAVRRRGREFESLLGITRGIVERLELRDILPLIAHSVNELMGTRFCLLFRRVGDELLVEAQEGLEGEVVEAFKGLRVGESLTGWVARHGEPLFVPDMRHDPRLRYGEAADRFGYRSYLGVPLRRGSETLGTLEVVTKEPRVFTDEDKELMAAFADQAAVALENARLFDQARSHLAELAEANRRLEELDRLRREYLRNVSHEFRTPLTVIKGYAEFLGESVDAAQRTMLRTMVESCDRVIDMVDTLIEVSRIEQGAAEQTLQLQQLDLLDVVTTSVDFLRAGADKKGIAIKVDPAPEPLRLWGDQGLLVQAVRKLVDNAVKYSTAGSEVLIRAGGEAEEAWLEVEDFGVGIAPEHQGRIFEKFYMVDGGITRRVGGTGVGLYLVREIVRLHGGRIAVRSLPGQGSVFTLRLPRRPQGARTQAARA